MTDRNAENIKQVLTQNVVVDVEFAAHYVTLKLDNGEKVTFALGQTINGASGSFGVLHEGEQESNMIVIHGGKRNET